MELGFIILDMMLEKDKGNCPVKPVEEDSAGMSDCLSHKEVV